MAENQYEAFIPYSRKDIIYLCLAEGHLDDTAAAEFQSFCEILSAFYHFRFHKTLENIKENYQVFDPGGDLKPLYEPATEEYEQMEETVVHSMKHVLERANYSPLPEKIIHRALESRSLISLRTEVDFNDFDQFLCYYRGDVDIVRTVKKFYFWEKEETVDILERLVLLIKFKGKGYFQAQEKQTKRDTLDRKFKPGKMYIYFYKNIPKFDIELLFPNIQTSMTVRDRLMVAVPAIGAAVPLILKTLPNMLLLVAAILIAINAQSVLQAIDVEEEQARNIMPVLVATMSLLIALGGFAFKQYSQYKSKKIKFHKEVTDTLFFKNLANNTSVFQCLTDIAEEEECKEILLVYYHLLTSSEPLTPEQLDAKIEAWMLEKTGTQINFDIQGPLQNLQDIRGRRKESESEQPLLEYDAQGRCQIPSLQKARSILDYVWDNAFRYNGAI